MRNLRCLFIPVFLFLSLFWATPSPARWYEDYQFGFRINAPENWQSNTFTEGADRVWAFASADQNVAVRVRAFSLNPGADIFAIISVFESGVFGGGQRLALQDHTLNGIQGKLGAYQGVYNGNQVGVGAFYTIQNGNAYIIWSMIPTHLFNARSAEADAVINTFTLTRQHSGAPTMMRWYEDDDFHFKIRIPSSWQDNRFTEGSDKVYAFLSPDKNLAIRIRAFRVDSQLGIDPVISLFESNIFGGGERLILKNYVLNGISGMLGSYRGNYNGIPVSVGAFYTIQNGIAYIVWTMFPQNISDQRTNEADSYINTFIITSSQSPRRSESHPGYQGMKITGVRMGDHLTGPYDVASVKYHFDSSTPEIFLVFHWSGDVGNSPFLIKWTYTRTGYLIDQITLMLPQAPEGLGKGSLTRPDKGWPSGEYSVEIIHNSRSLKKVLFSIGGLSR